MLALGFVAIGLVLLCWFIYPAVMKLLARHVERRPGSLTVSSVTAIIATREHPDVVVERVRNLRDTDFAGALDVVVAVDHRAAFPLGDYARALADMARVTQGDAPGGKASTLNAAVRMARGELLVFADSHQAFDRRTVPELAAMFADPAVGAASGSYSNKAPTATPSVLDRFWEYESSLRRAESAVHSIVAVTGCNYAMRRRLWEPLPTALLCDDLLVPMTVAMNGSKVVFAERAHAYDPRRFTRQQEFNRKVRTLTGMLQVCAWQPSVLMPWRNPVWCQFVCHKLLRLATPYLLLLGVASLAPAVSEMFTMREIVMVVIGSLLAGLLIYLVRPALVRRVAEQGAWSLSLLASPLVAGANAVRGRWDVWRRP